MKKIKTWPRNLNAKVPREGDDITVTVDMLNASETLYVSTVVRNPIKATPMISVRGKGVVGEEKAPPGRSDGAGVLVAGAVIFILIVLLTERRR